MTCVPYDFWAFAGGIAVMVDRAHEAREHAAGRGPEPAAQPRSLRVISWNLLRLVGARVADVAALIERHHPDLLLMQEATEDLARLPSVVGGHFFREPMHGRIYGLAVWSPHPLKPPHRLLLPASNMPGHVPPRVAQIVRVGNISFANVHLSHGQILNRFQLLHIVRSLDGPAAVVGDYNAVGPIRLPGLRDVGPRQPTHMAQNIISLRLDRCMVRGLRCRNARVLERGPSDHHPIILDLDLVPESAPATRPRVRRGERDRWRGALGNGLGNWIRAVSLTPERIGREPGAAKARRRRRTSSEGPHPAREEEKTAAR